MAGRLGSPAVMTRRRALSFGALVLAVSVLAVGIVYWPDIGHGFYYDDYHFIRPPAATDAHRVWYGSWDPSGIESVFFRPLTAALFAGRFWLFGLNASALHWVSLVGQCLCAALTALVLRREGATRETAVVAAMIYAVYPTLAYAQVSWLTNQMHLAVSLTVLCSCLAWQTIRDRHAVWLLALLPFAAVAFLLKEDGIMLLPAISLIAGARRAGLRSGRWRVLCGLAVMTAVAVVLLVVLRQDRIGAIGGYGVPTPATAFGNYLKGFLSTVFLWPDRNPWRSLAMGMAVATVVAVALSRRRRPSAAGFIVLGALLVGFVVKANGFFLDRPYPLLTVQAMSSGVVLSLLAAGGYVAIERRDRTALFLMVSGIALVAAFDMPFIFVSKREQYHLLSLGSVVALAGAAEALLASTSAKRLVVLTLCVSMVPLILSARLAAADFAPCAPAVLQGDTDAHGWWPVPEELKSWLSRKTEACATGQTMTLPDDLEMAAWGLNDEATEGDSHFRWTSDHVVLHVRRDAHAIDFVVRYPDADAAQPTMLTVVADGRAQLIPVRPHEWVPVHAEFRDGLMPALRQGHRVDLSINPYFVPALKDRSSGDVRRHGLQFRMVAISR